MTGDFQVFFKLFTSSAKCNVNPLNISQPITLQHAELFSKLQTKESNFFAKQPEF